MKSRFTPNNPTLGDNHGWSYTARTASRHLPGGQALVTAIRQQFSASDGAQLCKDLYGRRVRYLYIPECGGTACSNFRQTRQRYVPPPLGIHKAQQGLQPGQLGLTFSPHSLSVKAVASLFSHLERCTSISTTSQCVCWLCALFSLRFYSSSA